MKRNTIPHYRLSWPCRLAFCGCGASSGRAVRLRRTGRSHDVWQYTIGVGAQLSRFVPTDRRCR